MISDDDICVTTMLMMMIMQMMKMENEDGDDDDNEDDDEDDDDGDDDDDATFAILCYSDRARLVARQSVSWPRAPGYDCQKTAMRCCNVKLGSIKNSHPTYSFLFLSWRRQIFVFQPS